MIKVLIIDGSKNTASWGLVVSGRLLGAWLLLFLEYQVNHNVYLNLSPKWCFHKSKLIMVLHDLSMPFDGRNKHSFSSPTRLEPTHEPTQRLKCWGVLWLLGRHAKPRCERDFQNYNSTPNIFWRCFCPIEPMCSKVGHYLGIFWTNKSPKWAN